MLDLDVRHTGGDVSRPLFVCSLQNIKEHIGHCVMGITCNKVDTTVPCVTVRPDIEQER